MIASQALFASRKRPSRPTIAMPWPAVSKALRYRVPPRELLRDSLGLAHRRSSLVLVQDAANLDRQVPPPIRLAQNRPFVLAIGADCLLRISRRQQDLDRRPQLLGLAGEGKAGEFAGHHDVAEKQIDMLRAAQQGESRLAALGSENPVAELLQLRRGCLPKLSVVFGDQDSLASTRKFLRRFGALCLCCCLSDGAREIEFDGRAVTDLAVDFEMAIGLLGEAIDHAEAKPGPLALLLGREERFGGALDDFRRHSRARVGDGE